MHFKKSFCYSNNLRMQKKKNLQLTGHSDSFGILHIPVLKMIFYSEVPYQKRLEHNLEQSKIKKLTKKPNLKHTDVETKWHSVSFLGTIYV